MRTDNVSTLKIHKLTQEQYNRELANGNLDEFALYLTPEEEIEKCLPLSGGYLSGKYFGLAGGYGQFYASENAVRMDAQSKADGTVDNNASRRLVLFSKPYKPNVADSLQLNEYTNGSFVAYDLFGEFNKPSGSFVGDGLTTGTRTIDISGIGNALLVTGYNDSISDIFLVTSVGAICGAYDRETGEYATMTCSKNYIKFADGILSFSREECDMLCASGVTYNYQVL